MGKVIKHNFCSFVWDYNCFVIGLDKSTDISLDKF